MKKVVITLFIAFCATASFAQGRFSVGPELAIPQGDWADVYAFGIGASVRYESPITDNLSWMGTVGTTSFLLKSEFSDADISTLLIPINAGLKYYFTESFTGFYGGIEAGINIAMVSFDGESESESRFGFAPQLGYHLGAVDIAARYQIIEDANYIGLRVAYVFGGK